MLRHQMASQGSCRHLIPALPAGNPSLLALPVFGALPCDTPPVRRLRLIPRRLSGVVDHDNCLADIGPQAHSIKEADQGVECTLEPAGVGRGNHEIFSV